MGQRQDGGTWLRGNKTQRHRFEREDRTLSQATIGALVVGTKSGRVVGADADGWTNWDEERRAEPRQGECFTEKDGGIISGERFPRQRNEERRSRVV